MAKQWVIPAKGEVVNEVAANRQWMSPVSFVVVVEAVSTPSTSFTGKSAVILIGL
jgi:hypothetical protein